MTAGGVLFELDFQPEAFGAIVPDEIIAKWRAGRHWQVIGQAELAPVLIATKLWEQRLRNRHVIIWIDQNAARQGLIKGYSPSEHSAAVIDSALEALSRVGAFPWFARVPTTSNIADLPSRLKWDELRQIVPGYLERVVSAGAWADLE